MDLFIEYEQETDGRWLAEVSGLPGVMAYGVTSGEAVVRAEALALRALAERLEHSENRKIYRLEAVQTLLMLKSEASIQIHSCHPARSRRIH